MQQKHETMLVRPRARSTTKIRLKQFTSSQSFHRTLGGAFRKSTRESDLNHGSSSLLIRRLKNNTGLHLQQTTHKHLKKTNRNSKAPAENSLGCHSLVRTAGTQPNGEVQTKLQHGRQVQPRACFRTKSLERMSRAKKWKAKIWRALTQTQQDKVQGAPASER
jgi:hypothetical protein